MKPREKLFFAYLAMGILTLFFVSLKADDLVDFSWWWAFSPLWLPAALVLSMAIVTVVVMLLIYGAGMAYYGIRIHWARRGEKIRRRGLAKKILEAEVYYD